jgi:hypothetical protein
MIATPTASRTLANSPTVIFIVYTVSEDAEQRGYSDWLRQVDNPFFNSIPGVRCYANWRVDRVVTGGPLAWDYFDFQGLSSNDDLESVWFNPDLDAFRREWLRLWGYGRPEPLPIHRHAYLMRPVGEASGLPTSHARIVAGSSSPPVDGNIVFRVEAVLSKHFVEGNEPRADWCRPANEINPLGLDWLSLSYEDGRRDPGFAEKPAPEGTVELLASLIAAPSAGDRTG